MPLKVLIAPDKFKGTLTAQAAAEAIASGWRRARPRDHIAMLPATDGGDGFGEVMGDLLSCSIQKVRTEDAAHRTCLAQWWWEPKTRTAILESANTIGLAQLPKGRFHPFELGTFGLGAVIEAAAAKGALRCLIGIGGSATNDGGFGLARSLGWKFLTHDGAIIERWTDLDRLNELKAPRTHRWFKNITVAVDVANPLLGVKGATRVYGPQKGMRTKDFGRAERCLRRLAFAARTQFGQDFASEPGAGAAGGLGFGLRVFCGAKLVPGFDLFARQVKLDRHLCAANVVITGEGAIDDSTLMGKGAGEIARRCRKLGIPCIALAGVVKAKAAHRRLFAKTYALTDLTTARHAKANPRRWLKLLAQKAARLHAFEHSPKNVGHLGLRRQIPPRREATALS